MVLVLLQIPESNMSIEQKKRGRPRLIDRPVRTSIIISEEDLAKLNEIGRGNISLAIRLLVDKYRQALARIEEKNAA